MAKQQDEAQVLDKFRQLGPKGLAGLPNEAVRKLMAALFSDDSVWDNTDVGIDYHGKKISLPDDPERMPIPKAVEALQRIMKDQEQEFQVREVIDAFPTDGAVAFLKAMVKIYGFASPQTVVDFWGAHPPTMLTIKTGHRIEDVMQVPMGRFLLPGVDNPIDTGMGPIGPGGNMVYYVQSKVKKKDQDRLLKIVHEARRIVRDESIYRGKPLRFAVNDDGSINMASPPQFMDVSDIGPEDVIFDDVVTAQIETSIMTPIKRMGACKQAGIPPRRSVLLEGPYGCGKSLTARLAARTAELNGWTFVLLDKVQGLKSALEFANRYAPAVVFAEDIDRIAQDRTEEANDLINIIQGVVTVNTNVLTVLTTNFVEKLNRAILRPGRLDAIIRIEAPSAETVERLIRHYAGPLLEAGADLKAVGEEMQKQIPASIREAVERSKLTMISRGADQINGNDLYVAAHSMKNHLALLNDDSGAKPSAGDKLAAAFREVVNVDTGPLEQAAYGVIGSVAADGGTTRNYIGMKTDELLGVANEVLERVKNIRSR